jgi:hypothetical protein
MFLAWQTLKTHDRKTGKIKGRTIAGRFMAAWRRLFTGISGNGFYDKGSGSGDEMRGSRCKSGIPHVPASAVSGGNLGQLQGACIYEGACKGVEYETESSGLEAVSTVGKEPDGFPICLSIPVQKL